MSLVRSSSPLCRLLLALVFSAPALVRAEEPSSPAPDAPEAPRRVVYLPESVKAQLKAELKEEVLRQAREEGWATPNALPAWTKRFTLHADARLRWEMVFFQKGNANTGDFPDFNAINQGAPFDVQGADLANDRYLNVDQNRRRPRLRARVSVDADLGAGFTVQTRLASGEGSTPVSTNQTLGGSAGDFSKYQLWLDRAALRYEPFAADQPLGFVLLGGRFGNPFFSTDLVWWDDLSFDGLAAQAWARAGWLKVFANGGGFPYFITGFDFPGERQSKLTAFDRWLVAGQLGVELTPLELLSVKLGGAFYYFDRIEGRLGSPCDTQLKGFSCDTDFTRPPFAQKGNSYRALRQPSVQALLAQAGGGAQYQYFGLAHLFRELAFTGRVEVRPTASLTVALDGEFVRNLGFSALRVAPVVLGPLGPCDDHGTCPYVGGLNGYLARLTVGSPVLGPQWSWQVGGTYRYLESDAVVDAFTDSDFGLGGTNLKGFIVSARVALLDGVLFSARWLSANQVSGPPYAVDVLHLEVSARY